MKRIFISYRRNDSAVFTGRLFDRLIEYYGSDSTFLDIDSIPIAVDFRDAVRSQIKKCGVFLAIIGKQWAGSSADGRRIDNPDDHVRLEIEQALANNKPTIPVYCDGPDPLNAGDLPASLQPLAYANACPVDPGRDFNLHVLRLRREINKILFPSVGRFLAHITARFLRRNAVTLALCLLFALLVFIFRDPIARLLLPVSGFSAAVAEADPRAFSHGRGGRYEIARGLPDRTALVSETDLVKTIRDSKQSFDVFAFTASAFVNNSEALDEAVRNGVKFRIVLLDHSEMNRSNVELHFLHHGVKNHGTEISITNAKVAHEALRRYQRNAPTGTGGGVEIRSWRGSFSNSFWVRDGLDPGNALAHIEITFFGDLMLNPSVRFGNLSPKVVVSLQSQFDYIWEKSIPGENFDGS